MSPPRTPVNGHHSSRTRPPTIRTGTEQAEAERDALQALFQLGSPRAAATNSSQHFVSASSAGAQQNHAAVGSQARFAAEDRVPSSDADETGDVCEEREWGE
ncbi:hypothetical protein LTR48_007533 [Friedmanniomyces endolithicus]|uniref:Uncharacterized protein n=1 Tax=Rachicladosporium monterosium TaxID=1507873 RepID=A0ABR0KVV2_9PEZI|nr:hypothetical protein LTR48_007533 [Friedmanniomyces endolithicus]KAK5139238.1 hypothetical protein LTR32_007524 [Rachicladosporium monterosium]